MPAVQGPQLIRMSDVAAKEVAWLWKPYLPRGKITIVHGDPGEGKTTFVLALIALLTTGAPLPGYEAGAEPVSVLFQTAEDGLADTIKPRLLQNGADCSRVMVIDDTMASIRKRGNSYLLVVSMGYDYAGNRIKPVQKTLRPPEGLTPKAEEKWVAEQAVLFEREVKNERQPPDRNITLAAYIEIWLREVAPQKLAASTLVREKQDIARILPALGHYKLTELRPDILRAFHEKMRGEKNKNTGLPLAEKTVEGLHSCLCGILSDAVEAGYLTHNPSWCTYKPKGPKKERPIADEELLGRIVEALENESLKYETYFKLIILTGMRRGEAGGLKWSDINYNEKSIKIQRNIVKVSHTPVFEKGPKSAAGVRMVFISSEMCSLLQEYRAECAWQCGQIGGALLCDDDYLFRQPNGLPMNLNTFTHRFKAILRENGLPDGLCLHSLRHSNASLLISQNVDVRTVASLLGHAQASTTLDIYSHAFDKNKRAAGEKIAGVLEI